MRTTLVLSAVLGSALGMAAAGCSRAAPTTDAPGPGFGAPHTRDVYSGIDRTGRRTVGEGAIRREPGAGEAWHTLAEGESLSAVAKRYGTTLSALIERNDIQDTAEVRAGRQLIVPTR